MGRWADGPVLHARGCVADHLPISPSARPGRPEPVLLRQPSALRGSSRRRRARAFGADRDHRGWHPRGLRSHRAESAAPARRFVLSLAIRQRRAHTIRATARQPRESRHAGQYQPGQDSPQRLHRRYRLPVRISAGTWDQRVPRYGREHSRAERQRVRNQRHVRGGCARRDHRGIEWDDGLRVQPREGLALHAGWSRRAVERSEDRECADGDHVPAARGPGVSGREAGSDKYGKRVMVGMNHRFRSDVQAVRGFLAGGDLGGLQAVRGGWYTFQPSRQMLGWRLRREQAGGGAVLDLGLPLIDLGMWLAGWPAPQRGSAHLVPAGKDAGEGMGSALIVCENGVSVTMDVSWRHMGEGERFWFDIVGARGSATIQPLRIFREQHGTAVDVTPTGATGRETQFTQSYRAEWMYFLAVIKGDVNAPPPRDQLALQRVLDAIYQSAEQGRDIVL